MSAFALARADHLFHGRGNLSGKSMLLDFVPVSRLDGASAACKRGFADASGTVAALLVRGRIFLFEYLLSPEIWKFRVTMISQEKCLAAVADKHQGVIGYFQHFLRSSKLRY